mmetsp:Transcript_18096/g.39922  ORF Transcript_18096/g.39922 Transcript_18096/m.39922 type:complete len:251 (+) Transcript_18096:415-1167(+)
MLPTSTTTASPRNANPATVAISTATLVTKLIAMFCLILRLARCPSSTPKASLRRSESIKSTSAVSMAMAAPAAPIAIPTSAAARAGASLIPSPTIPTPPFPAPAFSSWTMSTFIPGNKDALASSIPTAEATAAAAPLLSPVSITSFTPNSRRRPTVSEASARGASMTAKMPMSCPSIPTHVTVAPACSQSAPNPPAGASPPSPFACVCVRSTVTSHPTRAARRLFPISTVRPPTSAAIPSPGSVSSFEML